MSETPVGAYPIGQDWTRSHPSVEADPKMAEILRASAFGRAKGRLCEALERQDAAAVDALLMALVDFALEGADARTILTGLV